MARPIRAAYVALSLGVVGCAIPAHAQVVERNLPPALPRGAPAIRTPTDLTRTTDETLLGATLRAIVLIGAKDKVVPSGAATGVDVSRIPTTDAPQLKERLTSFLGQSLTRKLLFDIQSAIAEVYRNAGRPFVLVKIPPQEITGGILHIQVIESRWGRTKVEGAIAATEAYIVARVRQYPGETIDARRLDTDLDWLNRNPFRQVEAVFGPGKDLGQTDLTLRTTERRPWQTFAGYANTGTRSTDRDRWFTGAIVGLPYDIVGSVQTTGSKDFWVHDRRWLSQPTTAQYQSQAGRLNIALWPRSSLEIIGNYVQTNERPLDPFRIRTTTTEVTTLYRTAVSNAVPSAIGDLIAGVEVKQQRRVTYFAEADAATGSADVFQLVAGWTGRWSDNTGTNNFDMRIKNNPGGGLRNNTGDSWSSFTNGRVTNVRMTFGVIEYGRVTPISIVPGLTLQTEVSALLSQKPVPDTERIGLGGAQQVRGYVTEDGTVDRAIIVRNSLYLPPPPVAIPQPPRIPRLEDRISPFLLADVGWGRDIFLARDTMLTSVGGGFDYMIGAYFRSNITAAYTLHDGAYTPIHTLRLHARATLSY